jgi:hypothetical protein
MAAEFPARATRTQVRPISTCIVRFRFHQADAAVIRRWRPGDVERCVRCEACTASEGVNPDGSPGDFMVCSVLVPAADLVQICCD